MECADSISALGPKGVRHPAPGPLPQVPFILASETSTLEAHGARRIVSDSVAGSLMTAASAALAASPADAMLVGALPFHRGAPAHLVIPERSVRRPIEPCACRSGGRHDVPRGSSWRVAESPSRRQYVESVRRALDSILPDGAREQAPALEKIVLARTLHVTCDRPLDPSEVFARLLCDHRAAAFCVPLPPHTAGYARTLVGASPELLIEKRGPRVISLPMAGSAERSSDGATDRSAADRLSHSAKDQREHRMVVEWVLDTLAPHCQQLRAPDVPVLAATETMWHLATPIEGELRGDVSSLELAAALHPTPAVCGTPCDRASAMLGDLERFDRQFFAGAVGWCDRAGNGRWLVTIRCAEISGPNAILYAGAGIVDGSDPESEAAETSAKFRTLLRALGIDEHGRPLAGVTA